MTRSSTVPFVACVRDIESSVLLSFSSSTTTPFRARVCHTWHTRKQRTPGALIPHRAIPELRRCAK